MMLCGSSWGDVLGGGTKIMKREGVMLWCFSAEFRVSIEDVFILLRQKRLNSLPAGLIEGIFFDRGVCFERRRLRYGWQ